MEALYNSRMRRVSNPNDASFAESDSEVRALRCIRMATLRAFAAQYAGQVAGQIGSAAIGDRMELEGLDFEFRPSGWLHSSGNANITLLPTCSPLGAAEWLRAFKKAAEASPGFIQGANVHHRLGEPQAIPSLVALAEPRQKSVTWFNHPNGFLLAPGLAETTKGAEHEIQMERLIHHETCHLYEDKMKDWLETLATDLRRSSKSGGLKRISEELNFQYLPDRIEEWEKRRSTGNHNREDQDMAAEMLVETYAHVIIEGKTLPSARDWPCLERLIGEMRERQIEQQPERPPSPPRIMRLPRTIEVSERILDRARALEGR